MLTKHLVLTLLGTALISAPVLAQTQPSSGQMNTSNWMTQELPGQWRASKLEGLNVYNNSNEKIGDISELIVDNSGKIQAVVIGVGGFLGMGEHDVAVPFDQIKFTNEPRSMTTSSTANPNAPATTGTVTSSQPSTANRTAPDHAELNMTKDQLKAAPEFKYAR
ncbi:PRC-barrel domain-containing protein [Microvirga sp. 2TAF3]|uniref:PRC-barrel domain-containing protein n=1 Tax=Microvirga sp. 2TAF3 TaxID=3233014 RepID=UPI003F97AAC2